MAFNTKSIIKDVNQKPVPQYYNPTTDGYEVVEGKAGATKVVVTETEGVKTFYGLSTDVKPADGNIKGNVYFEIDTTKVNMWNGTTWVVI